MPKNFYIFIFLFLAVFGTRVFADTVSDLQAKIDERNAQIKQLQDEINQYNIEVDNADEHFELVKKNGVVPRTEPKTWDWGKREFVVKDPDGYKFVFYSTVKKEINK